MRGTGAQMQFRGTGDIGNEDFYFGQHGNKVIYFRGKREQVTPPLGGPNAFL